ncbi:glycosyltransferase family 4 protein [Rhodospirillum centenum]|uniref:Glycosyl transferase, group 1 family protein n=1 Tax=Rhodospirillum centenum (strain ATCC 51521 / SW) TaxID=414684 RepID=B6IPD5_RHOCS|nr:glycosyltransferase family 1 protein [Rhodospirillum centenum]ACI99637.1 glycosyl transferase, group 1 family protein [Rhodospirillum centenum SW]
MKILIVTDAWFPQVNGVVRTLATTRTELEKMGHTVEVIAPDRFRTLPLPTYPEIRVAIRPGRRLARMIEEARPDAIHIATEGPLGFAARRFCLRYRIPFTTAYHTRFPEYVRDRAPIPLALTYAIVRRFHAPAHSVMVATPSIEQDLRARGFRNIRRWTRGVDTELFRPRPEVRGAALLDLPRPVFLYVGRVAVEKNIEAFLKLDLPGSKVVVGDGPQRAELQARYPKVHFAGAQHGEDLARHYAAADVFVFPSRTDTFGLVLLEALASGLPVAAYPVAGPVDVLGPAAEGPDRVGVLDADLGRAALAALEIDPVRCRDFAMHYSWQASAQQFVNNLRPLTEEVRAA